MRTENKTLYILLASLALALLAIPSAIVMDAVKSHFSFLDSLSTHASAGAARQTRRSASQRGPQRLEFVKFSINAPKASRAAIAADFNGWDSSRLELTKDKRGIWSAELPLPPGRYCYQTDLDGTFSPDPAGGETATIGDKTCTVLTVK